MLMLVVCTAVYNDCDPQMRYDKQFNTWKECVLTGHKESASIISQQPVGYVDENEIYIKFYCDKVV